MNPVQMVDNLRGAYIRYLESTIPLGDSRPELGELFHEYLSQDGNLFKGPYIEFAPPQRTGVSITALMNEGILSNRFGGLNQADLPVDRPLYLHQEQSVRRIEAEQNILVSAGTGAGKTECFLLPILNDIMRDQSGGVRAVLIYPMNALVQDQMDRLSGWFDNGVRNAPVRGVVEWEFDGWSVRLAQYTGSTLRDDDEGDARTWFREHCNEKPTILVTNFCMLNWMLLRPDDDPVFCSGQWKFFVLDEAHVYQGTQGSEIRYLLSRLKHRLQKHAGDVRCIASSATVARDAVALTSFASELFGEAFAVPEGVVFDERLPWGDFFGQPDDQALGWGGIAADTFLHSLAELLPVENGPASLATRIAATVAAEFEGHNGVADAQLLNEVIQLFENQHLVAPARIQAARAFVEHGHGRMHRILWHLLRGNSLLFEVGRICEEFRQQDANVTSMGIENLRMQLGLNGGCEDGLFLLLDLGHSAREAVGTAPLLPARYHSFYRGIPRLFIELHRDAQGLGGITGLSGVKAEFGPQGGRQFELYACRQCGQAFLVAYRHNQQGAAGQNVSYSWQVEPSGVYDPQATHDQRDYFVLPQWISEELGYQERKLCLSCGKATNLQAHCGCPAPQGIRVCRKQHGKVIGPATQDIATCPTCDARTSMGRIVAPLQLPSVAMASPAGYKHVMPDLILFKYIFDTFEEERAKLLTVQGDDARANAEAPDEYKAENVFRVPADARWSNHQAGAKQQTTGKTVDDANLAMTFRQYVVCVTLNVREITLQDKVFDKQALSHQAWASACSDMFGNTLSEIVAA